LGKLGGQGHIGKEGPTFLLVGEGTFEVVTIGKVEDWSQFEGKEENRLIFKGGAEFLGKKRKGL